MLPVTSFHWWWYYTLVITPTLSLIHDQVHHLCSKGIPATFLCSTKRDHTTASSISAGKYKAVYLTPERLFPGGIQPDHLFLSLAKKGRISLIAADEALCTFTWQSFRYVYRKWQIWLLHSVARWGMRCFSHLGHSYSWMYLLFCRPAYIASCWNFRYTSQEYLSWLLVLH